MTISRRDILLAGIAAPAIPAARAEQPTFPSKPIRMLLPVAPGGASDQTARNLQQVMQSVLGQPIVVESRPGASGNIAMEMTARAPADGYTTFLSTVAIAINPSVIKSSKLRPDTDLRGVSMVVVTPTVLVAHPSFEPNSFKELIAYARTRPGLISYASSGNGSVTRMEMEKYCKDAGISLMQTPYKGGAGAAINDVVAGHVPLTLTTLTPVLPLIRAGKLKALAVTSSDRLPLLPEVPTMAEQGFRQESTQSWQALFVPAATPDAVVNKLHHAVTTALNDPKVRRAMADAGQTPIPSKSPAEMDAYVRTQLKSWSELVAQLGVTAD